jgi:hypothetical protein
MNESASMTTGVRDHYAERLFDKSFLNVSASNKSLLQKSLGVISAETGIQSF